MDGEHAKYNSVKEERYYKRGVNYCRVTNFLFTCSPVSFNFALM